MYRPLSRSFCRKARPAHRCLSRRGNDFLRTATRGAWPTRPARVATLGADLYGRPRCLAEQVKAITCS